MIKKFFKFIKNLFKPELQEIIEEDHKVKKIRRKYKESSE
jgi:hypothetical protein|tara:strand:- start:1701 stop:1820 length:120 start_codon:yes stop_codon:yes gene_type:complete